MVRISARKKQLHADGFLVFRKYYSTMEVAEIANEMDRIYQQAQQYEGSYRKGNTLYAIRPLAGRGHHLRFVHWPAYEFPVIARYRTHAKQLAILEPFIGTNIKQIINSVSWKTPQADDTIFGLHQDSRFRQPATAFKDLNSSYIQVMLAIDPHTRKSGCLQFVRGSHRYGEFDLPRTESVMDTPFDPGMLDAIGLDRRNLVHIELRPGDVAIWLPHLVHGSEANRSKHYRRAFINGYVKAENSERGEWAFRNGAPCELGEPQ